MTAVVRARCRSPGVNLPAFASDENCSQEPLSLPPARREACHPQNNIPFGVDERGLVTAEGLSDGVDALAGNCRRPTPEPVLSSASNL